jgi:hypothetical protein
MKQGFDFDRRNPDRGDTTIDQGVEVTILILPRSAIATRPWVNLAAPLAEIALNLIALERLVEDGFFHFPNLMRRG